MEELEGREEQEEQEEEKEKREEAEGDTWVRLLCSFHVLSVGKVKGLIFLT